MLLTSCECGRHLRWCWTSPLQRRQQHSDFVSYVLSCTLIGMVLAVRRRGIPTASDGAWESHPQRTRPPHDVAMPDSYPQQVQDSLSAFTTDLNALQSRHTLSERDLSTVRIADAQGRHPSWSRIEWALPLLMIGLDISYRYGDIMQIVTEIFNCFCCHMGVVHIHRSIGGDPYTCNLEEVRRATPVQSNHTSHWLIHESPYPSLATQPS